ncbi:MAG: hypothetical protein ABI682_04065 [Acidobacteriota bacterium]
MRGVRFGAATVTVRFARSTTGFPSFARSGYGAVKYPTFSAAKAGSRPVMKTAEHMIFANPPAWWSRGSPGGGTYGVSSSKDFARARRAARVSASV